MKKILFTIFVMTSLLGCIVDAREEPVPCGYDEQPYYEMPLYCDVNPWTYEGECCTWIVDDFYSECVESWCYNEYVCGWMLNQRSCKPV
jgi:hypothetical protein